MEPESMTSPKATCAMDAVSGIWEGTRSKNGEVSGADHKGPLYAML